MNSDNYEFSKSSAPQSVSAYSAYSDKQWNYINDISGGVYANNSGLTLVQWDLTSIYNSAGFSDASDLYLAVPIVMCAATGSSTGGITTAPAAGYSLCTLKSNYQHLIHQLEIVCNGKTVEQMQPFISVVKHFQLLSQMSATDLKSNSITLGLSEVLDNEKSVQWSTQASAATPGGLGLCNNKAFLQSSTFSLTNSNAVPAGGAAIGAVNIGGTIGFASTENQLYLNSKQNGGTINGAIQKRISRIVDASKSNGGSYNNVFGINNTGAAVTPCILTSAQLVNEIKPYYIVSNNIMTWYDVGLIPLKYMSDFLDKLGLVKKLDLVIRAYFNTGSIQVPISSTAVANAVSSVGTDTFYGLATGSTFANTCPMTVNLLADTTTNGGFYYNATAASSTSYIAAGLFISKIPSTSIGTSNINFATNSTNHAMAACRCYYSQVKLDPSRALSYVQENRQKQVVYESVLFNQYTNITPGQAFSQLVQSGIKNPVAVVIVPFISSTCGVGTNNSIASGIPLGITQYGNPFDTSPSTYAPISLTNLSVTLGGVNVLNTSYNYTYENFLEQIVIAETLTSSDIGINLGLVTQSWWEMNRVYYIDLARSREADKSMPRNLNISFNNNTAIPIDIMVFTLYLDRVVIDIETGLLEKK